MTLTPWIFCALIATSAHADDDFDLCENVSREVAAQSVSQMAALPGAPAPLLPHQTLTAYEILRALARRACLSERRGSRSAHATVLAVRAEVGTGNSTTAHLIGRLLGRPVDHRFATSGDSALAVYADSGLRANLGAGYTIILDDFGKHENLPDRTFDLRRDLADVRSDSVVLIMDYGRRPWPMSDRLAIAAFVDGRNARGRCAVDLIH